MLIYEPQLGTIFYAHNFNTEYCIQTAAQLWHTTSITIALLYQSYGTPMAHP